MKYVPNCLCLADLVSEQHLSRCQFCKTYIILPQWKSSLVPRRFQNIANFDRNQIKDNNDNNNNDNKNNYNRRGSFSMRPLCKHLLKVILIILIVMWNNEGSFKFVRTSSCQSVSKNKFQILQPLTWTWGNPVTMRQYIMILKKSLQLHQVPTWNISMNILHSDIECPGFSCLHYTIKFNIKEIANCFHCNLWI